jgi:hypothetical protein
MVNAVVYGFAGCRIDFQLGGSLLSSSQLGRWCVPEPERNEERRQDISLFSRRGSKAELPAISGFMNSEAVEVSAA